MCDSSSKAKAGGISATTASPRMIFLRNSAFTPAALVVPGSVL